MAEATHLKSLQALHLAIREGSLKGAAARLGITPAAVGQRIRALETYLGTDLLVRGRSGLHPSPELARTLPDLDAAFAGLARVTEALDFQRVTEIHVVCDPDLAELWLDPRMPGFRQAHPNILFCVNGAGDVPTRLGAPDIRIGLNAPADGEVLFTDRLVLLSGPENQHRLGAHRADLPLEGLPALHTAAQRDDPETPGWVEWTAAYGLRETGADRGPVYRHARDALAATAEEVGFAVLGQALASGHLDDGRVVMLFDGARSLAAAGPYRMGISQATARRPQVAAFVDWLRHEAAETRRRLERTAAQATSD